MAKAYPRPVQGQGISREVGGADAPAGLWRHPESGQSAITLDDPLFGNAQSQGFKQMGFEYVRPAEEGEVVTMPQLAAQARQADEGSLKGLSARLNALEGVSEENKRLREENARLLAGVPQAPAETPVETPAEIPEKVKPLSKMNATELKATAEAEGVEVTKDLNTNKKLAAAVQAARDAKESEQK